MCAKTNQSKGESVPDADPPTTDEQYEKEEITYPEPPEELQPGSRNWRKLLLYFGPGAIVASMTLGSGETLFAPRGGAIFGFSIIWALVWAGFVKGVMTYSGVRYRTLAGENIMSRWAKLPGPRGWFTLLMGFLALLAFPSWVGGLAKMLGQITAWVLGLPVNNTTAAALGTIMIVVTFGLDLLGGYEAVERAQVVIVAFLSAAIAVLAIATQPPLGKVMGGLIPMLPSDYAPFVHQKYPEVAARSVWVEVVTYMGAVGGGIYDYIGYVGYTKQRNWGIFSRSDADDVEDLVRELAPGQTVPIDTDESNIRRGRSWLKAPQIDVTLSFLAITFFTATAMVLGAQSLNATERIPSGFNLYTYQATWFTDIAPGLDILWQIGVFFAIFGTMYATWEGYTWTWLMSFRPFSSRVRDLEKNNLNLARTLTFVYCGGLGLVLMWSDLSAVAIVTPASILGGVFGCGLWCFGMIWAEKTALPAELRGNNLYYAALVVSGLFLTFSGIISIIEYLGLMTF
ncbi:Nramp family divalent metal transporter [Halocatena marina]|uniref:Nramp family divalent metal transporter n=1 Tax=Halocatena marina TaxID=2934937 RepID=A0ABD5YI48_9EURY|nr:Nramp family divalent metal transporter [Halocatena marina]